MHIQSCHIQNPLFRTHESTKACRKCKMIMHIQSPGIEQFIQAFSRVFRHVQEYWCIFSHIHSCATRGERGDLPSPFWNQKKCPDFVNRGLDCVHLKFVIQNVVLRVSRTKMSKMSPSGPSFSFVFDKIFISPSSTTFLPCPEKF